MVSKKARGTLLCAIIFNIPVLKSSRIRDAAVFLTFFQKKYTNVVLPFSFTVFGFFICVGILLDDNIQRLTMMAF